MADPITFVYADWVAQYPEFAAVPEGVVTGYFNRACVYWRNDGTSPATTEAAQIIIMYLLTAHIAALYSQGQGAGNPGAPQDPNTPVGRISSVTEGTVTVATEVLLQPSGNAQQAWFAQTKYGLDWWAMTSQYRRFNYRPGQLQRGFSSGGFGAPLPFQIGWRRW